MIYHLSHRYGVLRDKLVIMVTSEHVPHNSDFIHDGEAGTIVPVDMITVKGRRPDIARLVKILGGVK